jgi:thiamine biosynthesis lipoprotein
LTEPVSSEFPLWGGRAVVAVTDARVLDRAVAIVQRLVERVDSACSSFRDDSELAALNRADGQEMRVSPLLYEYLTAGLRAAHATGGDVDPTVGEALLALGFHPGSSAQRFELRTVPGYETITMDPAGPTVRPGRGVRIDLGATAKALAADQAAAAAHQATGAGVLVGLGGDLAIAGEPAEGGWRIRVTDDHRGPHTAAGQYISLSEGGLATSSTTVRNHRQGAETVHHVIDPKTARPARVRFRTVSVAAASCLDANIASTAAIVRGEPAIGWLLNLRLPSRLVGMDGSVCHLAGWPRDGEELPVAPVAGPAVAA